MEEYLEEISRIKEALEQHPEGLSITDIAGLLHINRNSIAKYMDILQIQGSVDGKKRGTSKVYSLSHRVAVSSLHRICHQPFAVFDQDGHAVDHNTLFSIMTGLEAEEIAGQPLECLPFRILDGGNAQQIVRTALKGFEQQVRARVTGNGGEKTVDLYLLPVVFPNGKPGVAAVADEAVTPATAVSDRVPDPDLFDLMDNQVEYVVRYSPDGILQYVNEPYCRATGRSRGDLVGRPFKHLVSSEDAERISQNHALLSARQPSGMIEFKAVMANGEARWQRWWDRALFDERGEVTGYHSTGIDITDEILARTKLKKTQDMLEETIGTRTDELREINRQLYGEMACRERMEQQLLMTQFAMDNAPDMILWVNRNAGVNYANKAALSGLGYTVEECAHLTLVEIIAMAAPGSWTETWQFLRQAGTVTRETFMIRKDGTRIPVELVIRYLEYRQAGFACCFARDISERARMERTLQLANKKLNVLASLTRHDIQNKVTVLLGYLARARKREQDPEVLEYLERLERAARAIRDEITVTRDYKDLGADPPEWLNAREVVASAIARQGESPAAFDADLPPDLFVFADRQMERAFSRLFENAISADPPPPVIRIFLRGAGAGIVITVEHDGPGIRDEDKERIFEPGSTVQGMRGLFIVREVLSLTGISFLETGVPGKMTRFEICIPAGTFRRNNLSGM